VARQKVKFLFTIIFIVVIVVIYNFISSQATVYDTNFKNLEIHKNKITLYDESGEKIDTYTLKESIKAYSIGDID
jgi:cell division protein FtsL